MPEIINLIKRHEDGALTVDMLCQRVAMTEIFVLLGANETDKNNRREPDFKFSQAYELVDKVPCTAGGQWPDQRKEEHGAKLTLCKPSRKRLRSPLTDIVYAYEWRPDDEALPFRPPSAPDPDENPPQENLTGLNSEPTFLIPEEKTQYGRRRQKVLVVSDDTRQIPLPASLLGDAYKLLSVADKKDVLNTARHGDFDLVLFGCRRLGHDVLEVVKELKARCPQIPLMVVASEASGELVAEIFRAGIRDCLVGDVEEDLLRERLAGFIGIADVDRETQANFLVDSDECRAKRDTGTWRKPPAPYGVYHPGIQRAVKFIHREYARKLSLNEIAREACMSRRHFSRMFRKLMGLCPVEYVNRVRIEAAKCKLKQNGLSIAEVGLTGGFQSISYFHRVFKRLEGISPGVYRREVMRQENGPIVEKTT